MPNSETLAVIACEMRTYFQTQKRNGYPEHRPWHQVLSDWADRIEAEATTEQSSAVGNAAAMREAILAIKSVNDGRPHDAAGYDINYIISDALFASPRNCDRFAKWHEAWDAFRAEYGGPPDPGEMAYYFGVWLFAQTKGGKE